MDKVFLINGHQKWKGSPGVLNKSLSDFAIDFLVRHGFETQYSYVEDDYDTIVEVEKMIWADAIIYQFPVYWFSYPWRFKQYIDEVFMEGLGLLFKDDGRTRNDPSKKYGTGGLMNGRKYMISVTWNAPKESFTDPQQLFNGRSVDEVFTHFHKANEFLDLQGLPSFSCHDVIKGEHIQEDFQHYEEHLNAIFCK
ncbi:MAG: NAD(P)H-dependent oxidoreductase [Lentisphaeria bacterium]|nr:NAD(P)H-dependent oxidoreductase [Lentisphaeria bacterium]